MTQELEFKPFARQNDFISLPDTIFEALYGGAAGGGKTDTLLMIPIIREFYKQSTFKGLFLRRTFPELEREVLRRARYWLPLTGAKEDKENHSFKWPSGAYYDFGHCEHESDINKYDTAEYNYVAFDELTSFTEFQYLYIAVSRCRSANPNLPAIVRSGTNPDGPGHSFVKERFVEPCRSGYSIILDKLSGNKRIFIPARANDNPILTKNDPDYVKRLELLPEREKLAKLYGSWDIGFGSAFPEFRPLHLSDEPENALHVIPPIEIPSYWGSLAAMDWGWSANNVLLKARISPDRRIYITNCYIKNKVSISKIASDILPLCNDISHFFLDPSAWSKDPGKIKSIAQQFEEASGIIPYKADNDRVSGKQLIHEYLRWEQKDQSVYQSFDKFDQEFANKVLRIGGLSSYHKYLNQFNPSITETNLPKLQIFDIKELSPLIKIFPSCIIDEHNIEDVAEFNGDDPYDCLRYLLKGVDFIKNKSDPLLDKRSNLYKDYEDGKIDVNSFYRRMEYLEKLTSSDKVRLH